MEELKQNQIFMLSQVLDSSFNEQQWQMIKKQTPKHFLSMQEIILKRLISQKSLFQKFFQNFYSNHAKLLNWSLLAIEKKAEINQYIFKSLLSKGSQYFNKSIKQQNSSKCLKKMEEVQSPNMRQVKIMQEQVYKQFFFNLLGRNGKQSTASARAHTRIKQVENMDGHDFYIRTFNACNGWKYIFYNYEKHMKGLSEKSKYNQKIRSNPQKNIKQQRNSNQFSLLQYKHQVLNQCPQKIYSLSQIIKSPSMNNLKGLKSLVKGTTSRKLIFKNHLGKPITYRVALN